MIRLLFLLLAFLPFIDIGKINAVKEEARKAYLKGDYKKAADHYSYLIDSLGIREDEIVLNLANARYHLNDTALARQGYQQTASSMNPDIRSASWQQLGIINNRSGKPEQALEAFRQALKANPSNEDARQNYEMVKRKLEERKKEEENKKDKQDHNKKDKNQDQKNKEQDKKNQNQKDQQQQKQNQQQNQQNKSDQKKDQQQQQQKDQQQQQDQNKQQDKQNQNKLDPEKMKNMKMTEEKAKMILDAMKSNEVQYIQQNKRKATKPKDNSKPDW